MPTFDRVAPVFFGAKIVRSGNVSFLCLRSASTAITVRTQSVSGCQTCSVGRVLLSSQGSHPASRELKPCVPVEAFLSWGHLDVDGFLEQQLPGVPGHVNHCMWSHPIGEIVYFTCLSQLRCPHFIQVVTLYCFLVMLLCCVVFLSSCCVVLSAAC